VRLLERAIARCGWTHIGRIAQQAADANALFEQLFIDGIDGVMPLPIVSRKQVKR